MQIIHKMLANNLLDEWIHNKYLKTFNLLGKKFEDNKPFPYLEIEDFFKKSKIRNLKNALIKENFQLKESDLFTFLQTNDFSSSKNPAIKDFRNFIISKEFISFIEKIANTKLKSAKADMHGTCYADTHFLLCHDDQLDNRNIAMMVYLSDMKKNDGGSLRLYDNNKGIPRNISKSIIPKFNKIVMFRVSNISFHEVEEVRSNNPRIAISWWFYDK